MKFRLCPGLLALVADVSSSQLRNGRKLRGLALIPGLMMAWTWMSLSSSLAAGSDPLGPRESAGTERESEKAWVQLRRSAEQRLRSVENPSEAVAGILKEFEAFAVAYPGTHEATMALFHHGVLAAGIGNYSAAEESLKKARGQVEDPDLASAIDGQLARIAIRSGLPPPNFNAKSLDGKDISPTDYKENVLLLDFWATWCGPCLGELPNLRKIYQSYHSQGLEIVSVSLDQDEDALRTFIKKNDLPWTQVFNGSFPEGYDLAARYGVTGIPFMVLVGRDGKIAATDLRGRSLEAEVRKAVAETTAHGGN